MAVISTPQIIQVNIITETCTYRRYLLIKITIPITQALHIAAEMPFRQSLTSIESSIVSCFVGEMPITAIPIIEIIIATSSKFVVCTQSRKYCMNTTLIDLVLIRVQPKRSGRYLKVIDNEKNAKFPRINLAIISGTSSLVMPSKKAFKRKESSKRRLEDQQSFLKIQILLQFRLVSGCIHY